MAYTTRNPLSTKRAAKACLRCRERKVRCDVTRTELPCANCRHDGRDCVVVSRSRMRQEPLVEDIRTVKGTDRGTGGRRPQATLPREAGLASRGQALDSLDAKRFDEADSRSDLTADSSGTREPQFYEAGEALRDSSERDLEELDQGAESTPGYRTPSTSSDLALRPTVRDWIENDRSVYFLHEIGVL